MTTAADVADADLDLGHDRDPALGAPTGRELHGGRGHDGAADEQRVAVLAARTEGSGGGEHPVGGVDGTGGECGLVEAPRAADVVVDLLQPDDVGVAEGDAGAQPPGEARPALADPAVADVERGHAEVSARHGS